MDYDDAVKWVEKFIADERIENEKLKRSEAARPEVYSFEINLLDSRQNLILLPIKTVMGPIVLDDSDINDPADLPQWGFFVDDNPQANWEHPCRYLFVHEKTNISGRHTIIKSTLPFDDDVEYPITLLRFNSDFSGIFHHE